MSNTASAAEIVRATVLNGMQQDRCSCDTSCEERCKPITEMQASQIAAPSRFNVLIALKDGRSLAYNTQSSSFAVWTAAEVASYRRVERGELRMGEPDLKDFVTAGYIVPAEVDQIQAFEEIYKGARFDPFRMIGTSTDGPLELSDTRMGKHRVWQLDAREADIYRSIDEPVGIEALLARHGGDAAAIMVTLDDFVSNRLALREGGLYMALALPADSTDPTLQERRAALQRVEQEAERDLP